MGTCLLLVLLVPVARLASSKTVVADESAKLLYSLTHHAAGPGAFPIVQSPASMKNGVPADDHYPPAASELEQQEVELALKLLQEGLEQAEKEGDVTKRITGYLELGRYHQKHNAIRVSIRYLLKAATLSIFHNKPAYTAQIYALLSSNYHLLSLYETALDYAFKALQLHESLRDEAAIAQDYNRIGRVYQYTQDYALALSFFSKALALHTTLQEPVGRMKSILNIGVIHQKTGQFDSALRAYRQALPLAEQAGESFDAAKLTGNIGSTLVQQGRYEEGLGYLRKALAMKDAIQQQRSMLHTMNDIADVQLLMQDASGARATAEQVVHLARQWEEGNQLRYGYLNLSKSYKALRDFEKAHFFLEKYSAIKDSLFGLDKAQQINQLQIQYEAEKKDQAIATLEQEKALEDLKTRAYLCLGAILLIASSLLYNSQRLKTRKHRQLLAKGKEVDRLKSNFFANISHEFRTPLTLILGPIDTLLGQLEDPHQQQQLGFMKSSAQRLLRLINQILDLSKLEAGHLTSQPVRLDPVPLLRGITHTFSSLAEHQQIALNFSEVWEDRQLYADPAQLETIMINLLSNAFKFSRAGGRVRVEVQALLQADAHLPQGALEITIMDQGDGMTPEQLEHIFDRYYQAGHAAGSFYGGTGIGLALTRELVQLQGGRISVSSRVGEGTSVRVLLPLAPVPVPATSPQPEVLQDPRMVSLPNPEPAQPFVPGLPPNKQKSLPLLLLVEDHAEVREYLCSILTPHYRLLEAADGEEGLQQAFRHIPDLIISDVMMPRQNGYSLCRTLKQDERTSHIPLILLTAKASLHSRLEGLETEADLYLSKPFVPAELRLCIHNLLQSRKRLRERYQKDLLLQPDAIAVSSIDERFLLRLRQVLEACHADESFSVEQLSREMGMSRSQLHRKLEALTSESASQLIRSFRLQRAMDLLKKRHASISEIAYQVGFASPTYFNRCFLKHYGIRPSSLLEA